MADRTMFHVSISVAGAIELPDTELKSWIGNVYDDEGRALNTVREIRRHLAEEYAAGNLFIRQQGCDHFDPKKGCLGHPRKQEGQESL